MPAEPALASDPKQNNANLGPLSDKWCADGHPDDFQWVVDGQLTYGATIRDLPSVFAWNDASDVLARVLVLDHSVCARRLRSCFDHVSRFAPDVSKSMREAFAALPSSGKTRYMTAPETFHQMAQIRHEPAKSIISLCDSLNGESALHGCGSSRKPYWTALGDFYYAGSKAQDTPFEEGRISWYPDRNFHAPRLAGTIPLDFVSPHSAGPKVSIGKSSCLEFSPEERFAAMQRLEAALDGVAAVSEPAAQLIRKFVKVIVPIKLDRGSGSTSQPSYPGRVILRGIERCSPAKLASGLVHEAIHQLLYVVEYAGKFVMRDPEAKTPAMVKSLWTGRELELHSFIHACFVWYGLSQFWGRAQSSNAFKPEAVQQELSKCTSGFRSRNPIEVLGVHSRLLRYETISVAATLQAQLHDVLERTAA